ncbi:MAG: hypothetical protein ABIG45_03980 [Bacillota bacterium]
MLHTWFFAASAASASESKLAAMSIFNKGLFTTMLGLIGVFLVLTLFFVAIKLIQRTGRKTPDTKE